MYELLVDTRHVGIKGIRLYFQSFLLNQKKNRKGKSWESSKNCNYVKVFTLSLPEKLKNSIFEMPIITQTLNLNNLRTTSAKSINLHTVRKLVEYSLNNVWQRQCLLLPFSRYCCPKVGRYCDPPSGAHGAKGLTKRKEGWFSVVSGGLLCNRSSHSQKFFKIGVHSQFHWKAPVLESVFNKVTGLRACNFIKKTLCQRCFPVDFAKNFKDTFFYRSSPVGLLLIWH